MTSINNKDPSLLSLKISSDDYDDEALSTKKASSDLSPKEVRGALTREQIKSKTSGTSVERSKSSDKKLLSPESASPLATDKTKKDDLLSLFSRLKSEHKIIYSKISITTVDPKQKKNFKRGIEKLRALITQNIDELQKDFKTHGKDPSVRKRLLLEFNTIERVMDWLVTHNEKHGFSEFPKDLAEKHHALLKIKASLDGIDKAFVLKIHGRIAYQNPLLVATYDQEVEKVKQAFVVGSEISVNKFIQKNLTEMVKLAVDEKSKAAKKPHVIIPEIFDEKGSLNKEELTKLCDLANQGRALNTGILQKMAKLHGEILAVIRENDKTYSGQLQWQVKKADYIEILQTLKLFSYDWKSKTTKLHKGDKRDMALTATGLVISGASTGGIGIGVTLGVKAITETAKFVKDKAQIAKAQSTVLEYLEHDTKTGKSIPDVIEALTDLITAGYSKHSLGALDSAIFQQTRVLERDDRRLARVLDRREGTDLTSELALQAKTNLMCKTASLKSVIDLYFDLTTKYAESLSKQLVEKSAVDSKLVKTAGHTVQGVIEDGTTRVTENFVEETAGTFQESAFENVVTGGKDLALNSKDMAALFERFDGSSGATAAVTLILGPLLNIANDRINRLQVDTGKDSKGQAVTHADEVRSLLKLTPFEAINSRIKEMEHYREKLEKLIMAYALSKDSKIKLPKTVAESFKRWREKEKSTSVPDKNTPYATEIGTVLNQLKIVESQIAIIEKHKKSDAIRELNRLELDKAKLNLQLATYQLLANLVYLERLNILMESVPVRFNKNELPSSLRDISAFNEEDTFDKEDDDLFFDDDRFVSPKSPGTLLSPKSPLSEDEETED